jgi:RimJ/RimL family protein N-acetyltransferase
MATDIAPASMPAPRVASPGARGGLNWVPIRSLAPRHRARILDHLLALPEQDRYLRFGHAASDQQIAHYVDLLDFERDEVFGIFNRRLEIVAMAHLAYLGPEGQSRAAEFGVSVSARQRGRGLGGRLFDRAVLHARNRQIDTLIIHALSENTAMLRIARSAGALIERDGPESQAVLKLPPENLASHMEAMLERHAAEFDYGWKRQARRVDRLLEMIADVREGVGGTREVGSQ